jgi:hypothetical protein
MAVPVVSVSVRTGKVVGDVFDGEPCADSGRSPLPSDRSARSPAPTRRRRSTVSEVEAGRTRGDHHSQTHDPRLGDSRNDRQGSAANAACHLPAPCSRKNDCRGLKTGAAVATRNPRLESRGVRVQSVTGDSELANDAPRPWELDGDSAVLPGASVVGRADDALWVQLDPEPPIAMAERTRLARPPLAGWIGPVRQGDGAGNRRCWGVRIRRPSHVGRVHRPARGRVGGRLSDRFSCTRGEKEGDEDNGSAHPSSTPRHRSWVPTRSSTHIDERTARSDSLLGAVSRSSQALATQIPNRLAERLRVGNQARREHQDRPGPARPCHRGHDAGHLQPPLAGLGRPHPGGHRQRPRERR